MEGPWEGIGAYKQGTLIFASETKASATKKQTRKGCKEGARRVQGGCEEGAGRVRGGCEKVILHLEGSLGDISKEEKKKRNLTTAKGQREKEEDKRQRRRS